MCVLLVFITIQKKTKNIYVQSFNESDNLNVFRIMYMYIPIIFGFYTFLNCNLLVIVKTINCVRNIKCNITIKYIYNFCDFMSSNQKHKFYKFCYAKHPNYI